MKRNLFKSLILSCCTLSIFSISDIVIAHTKNSTPQGRWVCETNASSADNAADANADKKMQTKYQSASAAFEFAFRHCRDCTKITCTMEEINND